MTGFVSKQSNVCVMAVLLAAGLAAAPQRAGAQDAGQTTKGFLEASVIRVAFTGDEFATPISPGLGFDLSVVLAPDPRIRLAGGVQYSGHATTDTTGSLGALQFFIEPRVTLTTGRWRPYAGVRFGYVRTSQELVLYDDQGLPVAGQAIQAGQSYGGSAGVLYLATYNIRVYAGATAQKVSLGDIGFDEQHIPSSSVKGNSVIMRAGVSIDFSLDQGMSRFLGRR
jgi:hypothetical protein